MEWFGKLRSGEDTHIFTISDGSLTAVISDLGATVIKLYVFGTDVVLGFDDPNDYVASGTFFGSVVGRNCNRTADATVRIQGIEYAMDRNDNGVNNLHSGFAFYKDRIWNVAQISRNCLKLTLSSPDGDQGFPGNAQISVTYTLENNALVIEYDGLCDCDTVFNLTNHSYFNLAGHNHPERAMDQLLTIHAGYFTPADSMSIPTGEIRAVADTPMDFRTPGKIGTNIGDDYDALNLQGGYDHNFILTGEHCATLQYDDLKMDVYTDRPGVQFYSGNFLEGEIGKEGVSYCHRGGVCLETQYWPDATHHPLWPQPVVKAGEHYHSRTVYQFSTV